MVYFRVRYHLKFMPMSEETAKAFQAEYYRLVWDDNSKHVKDLHSCLPVGKRGLKCLDLESIRDATAISTISRMVKPPALAWDQLLRALMGARSRSSWTIRGVVVAPWAQKVTEQKIWHMLTSS
jgi:hypothetical protein